MPWIRTIAGPGAGAPEAHPMAVDDDLLHGGHAVGEAHWICTPDIARAITSRWISDVPSKIV